MKNFFYRMTQSFTMQKQTPAEPVKADKPDSAPEEDLETMFNNMLQGVHSATERNNLSYSLFMQYERTAASNLLPEVLEEGKDLSDDMDAVLEAMDRAKQRLEAKEKHLKKRNELILAVKDYNSSHPQFDPENHTASLNKIAVIIGLKR